MGDGRCRERNAGGRRKEISGFPLGTSPLLVGAFWGGERQFQKNPGPPTTLCPLPSEDRVPPGEVPGLATEFAPQVPSYLVQRSVCQSSSRSFISH